MDTKIILASASPRRRELVKLLNCDFLCMTADADETIETNNPALAVEMLSDRKASAVKNALPNFENLDGTNVIIGADTVVVCDGEIMGKPKDKDDAFRMLRKLSGKAHSVYTGITLIWNNGNKKSFAEETKVFVSSLSDKEINDYIKTNECWDKAGSYAIQGLFSIHIKKIDGDYNNVVGFPVSRIYRELTGK